MKRVWVVAFVMGLTVLLASLAPAAPPSVKVATKVGVGNYLVDASDKPLYWYKGDTPGKSNCSGECLKGWKVFFRDGVPADTELHAKDFAPIVREDGQSQSTFRGYPLYTFLGDRGASAKGHGIDGVWFTIDPANFPPKK